MLEVILVICILINILRGIATFGIFDAAEQGVGMSLINLCAITYCNKDKLTKFGLVLAVLADLVLLPGALFGSVVNLMANGLVYFVNKFCLKQN